MIKPSLPVSALLFCAFSFATSLFAQPTSLKTSLEEISRTIPADVGVAIIDPQTNDVLAINGDDRFPMQSVFKLHIALAALHLVDEGKLFLDQKYHVTKDHYFKAFPKKVLVKQHEQALLFKRLATLRTDAALFSDVDQLRWRGPTWAFAELTAKMDEPRLLARANAVAAKLIQSK